MPRIGEELNRLFLHKTTREFLKFCIVGFSGVFVDMGVVILFKELVDVDTRIAAVFGFLFAVTSNFILNHHWTFKYAKEIPLIKSYLVFVGVCGIGLLVRLGVMHALIEFCDLDRGRRYILNNFIGIVVATLVNFTGSKFFAFKAGKTLTV